MNLLLLAFIGFCVVFAPLLGLFYSFGAERGSNECRAAICQVLYDKKYQESFNEICKGIPVITTRSNPK